MRIFRYSKWDGSQFEYDPEATPGTKPGAASREDVKDFFQELSNNLIHGFSAQEALDWMMRNGFEMPSRQMRVMGLNELAHELRKQRQEMFEKYNLDNSLDEIKQALEDIRNFESQTLHQRPDLEESDRTRREQFLENLPGTPSAAIDALEDYDFLDERAREIYEDLRSKRDQIRDVENFRDRHQNQFTGEESLDFENASDMVNRFNQMQNMERALEQGDFQMMDLDQLSQLLSEEGFESLVILMNMGDSLRDAGLLGEGIAGPELTPKGMRRIGAKALDDLYADLSKDQLGPHETRERGVGRILPESSKPYQYGDAFHVNLPRTFMNALTSRGGGIPLQFEQGDFEVHEVEHTSQTATVMLVDMSWSMSWEGRFPAAKRVALALSHLIRTRFPNDHFYTVGFYTRARELSLKELPEIIWNSGDPFTNLQDGLRVADRLLAKHKNANKQIILVTDGQPTAYTLKGELLVEWPWDFGGISPRASYETLKEVRRLTEKDIRINTFMLDDSPALVGFINELSRINKGRAFYTHPDRLGEYLLVDFLKGRRKKVG